MLDIMDAVRNGDLNKVNVLLCEEPESVGVSDITGATPLHLAAATGNTEMADLLIQGGAQVNALDNLSYSPLHYAAKEGQKDVCCLLIERGGDLATRTIHGQTPLDLANATGHEKLAYLISINEGMQASILQSPKQANYRSTAIGFVIAFSLWCPTSIWGKLGTFVGLMFILGAVASSPKLRGRL
ncbi:MAG: ankyrin repeat domain-containing protein [Armatimonadetes bacterium]|nr:ankyrin repeat domain-containing protein [Armatimonadota bacterium]